MSISSDAVGVIPSIPDSENSSGEAPELIPARMLNEFAYCPRLAYLEWVQGEFADNLETLEGSFGHRRVDVESKKPVPKAGDLETPDGDDSPAEKLHARSITLADARLGLIAKLDLLELEGNAATPVDYKRGKMPDLPEGAWEPERVQLCAQGLLLRSAGYQCSEGVIYYIASRRRVAIAFDEALVARTVELLAQFRQTAAAGVIPPPLVDSPKCPRCSLVGICLPDEVNLLSIGASGRSPAPAAEEVDGQDRRALVKGEIRRLLPSRDDAVPLYVQEQGASVGKSGDRLEIKKQGAVLDTARLIDVSQIALFGNAQVTAPALREVAARGIPICHFSYGGWFHAVTAGMVHKNVELRIRQYRTAFDERESLRFARAFIVGKIRNGRTLLRRNLPDDPDRSLDALNDLARRAESAPSAETLLGVEGNAAKTYFSGFAAMLKGADFSLAGRNRRPPTDPVNALLSFLYSLLVKELTIALLATGFDPMLGFLHRPRYGRPSLALDIAEEFRPLIADSTVLTLINNGEVTPDDFLRRAGAVALTDRGRKATIGAFERRMDTLVTHPIFGYRIAYRRILEVQCRLLARALAGEIPDYPSFMTR